MKKSKETILTLFLVVLFFNFIFLGFGCEKKKTQTIADKPLSEFKADISVQNPPPSLNANSKSTIKVKIKNISNSLWPAKGQPDGKLFIHLAYHWFNKDGTIKIFDGERTPLPYDLNPGEQVVIDANVLAPDKAGEYILEFDMVQETIVWFKDKGSKTTKIHVKVE